MARVGGDELEEEEELDVFAIHHKHATHERLRQWRKATLALNATRRFRYTLNLERTEEARNFPSKKAVKHYQQAGTGEIDGCLPPRGFGVGPRNLQGIVKARELSFLHQLGEVSGVAKSLRTNIEEGLSGDTNEILLRKIYFGENNYPRKKQKRFFVFVWETFQDTTLIILMLCAAISLITGMTSKGGVKEGWYDGTSIACAILAVVLVTALSDYKQSLEFQALNDEKKNIHVQVVRMGRTFRTSIFELVVGDIVPLNIGDQVTGVGLNTEWGQIMAAISEDIGEETPLQVRLNGTATFIGKVGLIVSVLVFSVLFIRYFTDKYNKHQKASEVASSLSQIFSIAVVIVVIAVPEGLPLAVTLTLAYSMRKMMADKSLVRNLSACETMGSATIICSDKTGTLTLNEMTVVKAWVAGKFREAIKIRCSNVVGKLIEGIAQNCTGMVSLTKGGDPEVTGSPTEKALLTWGLELGMDFRSARAQSSVYQMEAFNSIRKRAGVAIILSNGDARVHWKGAAEVILDLCSSWLDVDGRVSEMSNENVWNLKEVISEMATNSLRCIAYAYRDLNKTLLPENEVQRASWKIPDTELTISAIVGIKANIGLAMGISGTEVAKESSDVIILDDNFASVVKMMRWGRSVYANIQKFIQFQLTVNVAALAINFVAAVSNGSVPLQTVQMLWVNLIMDTLGALALATEPPTDDLMSKPSIGLRDPLVTNVMWRNILGQAAFQVMVLLTLFYKGIDLLHLDGTKERKDIVRNTTIFNTFVFCQLFNEINARKPEEYNVFAGILKNRMFVSVVVISIIFQGIMVESLNKFAKTTKLSWEQWLISIGIGFLSLPIGLVLKFIKVSRKPLIMTHKIRRKRRSRPDRHAHQQSANEQLDFEQTT